jgi:sigma-E factor negative regulatory protein RseA
MTQELSSLMDGELEPQDAERAIRACCASAEAKQKWLAYHVISETLRGHPPRSLDEPRALAALQQEPAIIARPKRVYETTFGRMALAAAASVATIGVVGWIGSQGGPTPGAPIVAKNPSALQPVANVVPQAPAADMQDYVAAHKQLPSVDLYRPVNRTAPAAAAR